MSATALASRAGARSASDVAREAGVPAPIVEMVWGMEVIDLHLESFIPPRLWGFDLLARHERPLGGRFFGHVDVPRAIEGGLTGAMWSIATNIARRPSRRFGVLTQNVEALRALLASSGEVEPVRTHAEWVAARARGKHAALICVQGGNAYEGTSDVEAALRQGWVSRVTLMHLTSSIFGATSTPIRLGFERGLTDRGREMVEALDAARVFVDLAHASERTFWDVVEHHDRSLPLIVTHTGASAAYPLWRNVDARQIRAIADSGGVVGVIFQASFLGRSVRDGRVVIDHLEAMIDAGGEEVAALGSDYDGFIIPPPDLRDGASAYYRLAHYMSERGWRPERIRRVLGENFLSSLRALRP